MATNENPRLRAINETLEQVRAIEELLYEAQTAEMTITENAAEYKMRDVDQTRKAALCVFMAERNATTLRRKLRHTLRDWFPGNE